MDIEFKDTNPHYSLYKDDRFSIGIINRAHDSAQVTVIILPNESFKHEMRIVEYVRSGDNLMDNAKKLANGIVNDFIEAYGE